MICGPDEEGAHAPDTELGIAPTSTADVEPDVYDDELPTLTRKKSASVFEELKVVRSRCPGASQVYPAAALILASFTLVLSIIINRSTYNASACPKGTDFFVLASSRNLSEIGCFSEGLCKTELDKGLELSRVACPIGVICVIFESRPEAAVQIASLTIRSGNAVILKGGKEAANTNAALVHAMQCGLAASGVMPASAVQLVQTREEISELLDMHGKIDLIVPRGSNERSCEAEP